eukprot:m.105328 g.105328  ORF g.105328 m.105328 type:complete len:346 (+) comp13278_c1_seq3:381-1418(+)
MAMAMASLACVLFAVLVGSMQVVVLASTSSQKHLDEHTDFNPDVQRIVVNGQMWQEFTAHWQSELVALDVFMGTTEACTPSTGTLRILDGSPEDKKTVYKDTDQDLYSQHIQTSCTNPSCVQASIGLECSSWETFILDKPLPVNKGQRLTFVLQKIRPAQPEHFDRRITMGASPSSENFGGDSSLPRGKTETRYAQYTFRTWLGSERPADDVIHGTNPPDQRTSGQQVDGDRVGATGIVVPIVVVSLAILVVMFIVRQRRKHRRSRLHVGDTSLSDLRTKFTEQDELDGGRGVGATLTSRRHPIQVREKNYIVDDSGSTTTWADVTPAGSVSNLAWGSSSGETHV